MLGATKPRLVIGYLPSAAGVAPRRTRGKLPHLVLHLLRSREKNELRRVAIVGGEGEHYALSGPMHPSAEAAGWLLGSNLATMAADCGVSIGST